MNAELRPDKARLSALGGRLTRLAALAAHLTQRRQCFAREQAWRQGAYQHRTERNDRHGEALLGGLIDRSVSVVLPFRGMVATLLP